jgi:hypothetical protein
MKAKPNGTAQDDLFEDMEDGFMEESDVRRNPGKAPSRISEG